MRLGSLWPVVVSALVLAGPLATAGPACPGGPGWTAVGPDGGTVLALAAAPQGGVVYVGTMAGVFRTTDGGARWTPRNGGLPPSRAAGGLQVRALAVDAGSAHTVYASVALHVVGANDVGAALTPHHSGRLIPTLALPPEHVAAFPPPFTPPCAFAAANGAMPGPALDRLGLRRLRIKAARVAPLVASSGPGQAPSSKVVSSSVMSRLASR